MGIDLTGSFKQITWDVGGKLLNGSYFGKKDDSGRGIKVKLLQNSVVITPTTETLRIYIEKPDKKRVYLDALPKSDHFEIKLTNEVYAVPGDAKAELQFNADGEWVSSDTFVIEVKDSLIDRSIESSNELRVLTDALNKVDHLEQNYAPELNQVKSHLQQTATKTELNTVDAKVNNILALPEGSTTNDARLEDIKIGFDGREYNSPGNAVRDQIGLLKSDVMNLQPINQVGYKFRQSIENIGTIEETTEMLSVNDKYDVVAFNADRKSIISRMVAKKDYYLTKISIYPYKNTNNLYTLDTMFRIYRNGVLVYDDVISASEMNAYLGRISSYNGNQKSEIYKLEVSLKAPLIVLAGDKIDIAYSNDTDGVRMVYITPTQTVTGNDFDVLKNNAINTSGWLSSKNKIVDSDLIQRTYYIPCNLYGEKYKYDTSVIDERIASSSIIVDKIIDRNVINPLGYLLGNIISVGDSLTQGYLSASLGHTKFNYPYFLSKLLGGTVKNEGASGFYPIAYWNSKMSNINFASYDTCILWLGTNQGLTDTLESDVIPYANYTDYAETNTGCYCKMIEKMKLDNEHITIFLCTCFDVGGRGNNLTTTNHVIRKIATRYNLPVIDMNVSPLDEGISNALIHPIDRTHCGAVGYLTEAQIIYSGIISYVNDNQNSFNYIF